MKTKKVSDHLIFQMLGYHKSPPTHQPTQLFKLIQAHQLWLLSIDIADFLQSK